jgi:hypothetical protein
LHPIHWYLDDVYAGRSEPEAPIYLNLTAGEHKLVCLTREGQTRQARFTVSPPGGAIAFNAN